MTIWPATLEKDPFFADFDDSTLDTIAAAARRVQFAPLQPVIREGDPADEFYLVTAGRLAVQIGRAGRPITVMTVGVGDVLGFSWLLPPYRWRFGAVAVNDVDAIAFDGASLREQAAADEHLHNLLVTRFFALVVSRLEATRVQTLDLYAKTRDEP